MCTFKYVPVENELNKIKKFDSSFFIVQSYFNKVGAHILSLPNIIWEWESKGLWNEKFRSPYTSKKILSPKRLRMNNSRIILRFEEIYLKQENATPTTPNNVINSFTAYELGS